jgi:hypothetical protein
MVDDSCCIPGAGDGSWRSDCGTRRKPAPSYGLVSGEVQDPGYQYRSMPALRYVSWVDAQGESAAVYPEFSDQPG